MLALCLAYYKKLPKVAVSAPTKKESVPKALAEKLAKGNSGAGEGGKGAKDLLSTVEMLEQRVKTLEVNMHPHPSACTQPLLHFPGDPIHTTCMPLKNYVGLDLIANVLTTRAGETCCL